MSDFSQNWLNVSSKSLSLVTWDCSTEDGPGSVYTSPGNTLDSGNGQESLSWSPNPSSISSGDGDVVWCTPNGTQVGVRIHVPLQIGPFGNPPCYEIKIGDDDWTGNYTSEVYNFDKDKTGVNITVRPVAGHSNLNLSIEVTD